MLVVLPQTMRFTWRSDLPKHLQWPLQPARSLQALPEGAMLAVCPLTTAATKSDTLISTRARSPGSAGMGRPRRCKSSHSVIEQHPWHARAMGGAGAAASSGS